MGTGWIAFLILLAYMAGAATALYYGQYVVKKNPEKYGKTGFPLSRE